MAHQCTCIHITPATQRVDSWLLTASPSRANRGEERITPPFMLTGQRLQTSVKDYRPMHTPRVYPPDDLCLQLGQLQSADWYRNLSRDLRKPRSRMHQECSELCDYTYFKGHTLRLPHNKLLRLWALAIAKILQTSARCMGGSKPGKISTVVLQHRPNYTNYHKLSHNYHLSGETHWCKKKFACLYLWSGECWRNYRTITTQWRNHRTRNSLKQRMFTKLSHYCHRAEKHIDAEIVCLFILWSRECSECSYSNDLCTVHFL